jgi:hypothetical protein
VDVLYKKRSKKSELLAHFMYALKPNSAIKNTQKILEIGLPLRLRRLGRPYRSCLRLFFRNHGYFSSIKS